MKRNSTILVICGLLLLADAIIAARTITEQTEFVAKALAAEIVLALAFGWVAFEVFRKKYRRQKRPATRWRFAVVQPLRRLFVSVWS